MSNSISNNSNRKELSEQYVAQKSEREALQKQHEAEMENLKHSYSVEKAVDEDRFESSIQAEKTSHYDQLRAMKGQMDREQRRLEQTKREVVGQKESELKKEEMKTDIEGRARLQNLQKQITAAEEYERARAAEAQLEVQTRHKASAETILSNSNKQIQGLREQKELYLGREKEVHSQSLTEMQTHYDQLRTGVQQQYGSELQAIKSQAAEDLNQKRLMTTAVIQQYSDRARDPFYHMNRFETEVFDLGEAYSLRIKVPSYERNQFRVQVSNQEVQLMGVRSHNEKAEVEPGRWITTSSHQNVSERIPLDSPIDGKTMTMKENGAWLEYTIPKFGARHRMNDQLDEQKIAQESRSVTAELDFAKSLPTPTIVRDQTGKGTLT